MPLDIWGACAAGLLVPDDSWPTMISRCRGSRKCRMLDWLGSEVVTYCFIFAWKSYQILATPASALTVE